MFRRSPWASSYKTWKPNLIFDALHRRIIDEEVRGRVLDIGGGANEWSPLNFPYFRESAAQVERIGINLAEHQVGRFGGFQVLQATGHGLPFADASFDCVICNAMLEHDPRFWQTLAEVRRVLRPRGLFIVGVPGYVRPKLGRRLPLLPGNGSYSWDLSEATLTYCVHQGTADYYRFSESAVQQVLLEGFEDVKVESVMQPPRLLGSGRKTGATHRTA